MQIPCGTNLKIFSLLQKDKPDPFLPFTQAVAREQAGLARRCDCHQWHPEGRF